MPAPRKGARAAKVADQAKRPARLEFEVPLPPQELSPNSEHRHNWPLQGQRKREYKEVVRMLAMAAARHAGWVAPKHVRVSLVFQHRRGPVWPDGLYRPVDVPNAVSSWKAGFDGLVASGLFADDRHSVMALGAVTVDVLHGPGVIVVVEAMHG